MRPLINKDIWRRLNLTNCDYEIDWDHPLTRGLVACYLPGVTPIDLTSQCQALTYDTGTGQLGGGLEGLAHMSRATNMNAGFVPIAGSPMVNLTTATTLTCFWRGNSHGVSSGAAQFAGVSYDNTGATPFFFWAISNASGTSTAKLAWNNNGTAGSSAAVTYPTNATFDLAGSFSTSAGAVFYLNGALQSTTAWGSGSKAPTKAATATFNIGTTPGLPTRYLNCDTQCVFVWNRVLSADEIAWLHRDPYAFLQPQESRIQTGFQPPQIIAEAGNATDTITVTQTKIWSDSVNEFGSATDSTDATTGTPVYTVKHYAIRTDSGTIDAAATFYGGQDILNPATFASLRFRYVIDNTGVGLTGSLFTLYQSVNGGAYTALTGGSSPTFYSNWPNIAESTPITVQQLTAGSGTWINGLWDTNGSPARLSLNAGNYTELEFGVYINGSILNEFDTVELRVYANNQPLNNYSVSARVVIGKYNVSRGVVNVPTTRTYQFQEDNTAGVHGVYQNWTPTAASYQAYFEFLPSGPTPRGVELQIQTGPSNIWYDVNNNGTEQAYTTSGTGTSGAVHSVTAIGGGWFAVSLTFNCTDTGGSLSYWLATRQPGTQAGNLNYTGLGDGSGFQFRNFSFGKQPIQASSAPLASSSALFADSQVFKPVALTIGGLGAFIPSVTLIGQAAAALNANSSLAATLRYLGGLSPNVLAGAGNLTASGILRNTASATIAADVEVLANATLIARAFSTLSINSTITLSFGLTLQVNATTALQASTILQAAGYATLAVNTALLASVSAQIAAAQTTPISSGLLASATIASALSGQLSSNSTLLSSAVVLNAASAAIGGTGALSANAIARLSAAELAPISASLTASATIATPLYGRLDNTSALIVAATLATPLAGRLTSTSALLADSTPIRPAYATLGIATSLKVIAGAGFTGAVAEAGNAIDAPVALSVATGIAEAGAATDTTDALYISASQMLRADRVATAPVVTFDDVAAQPIVTADMTFLAYTFSLQFNISSSLSASATIVTPLYATLVATSAVAGSVANWMAAGSTLAGAGAISSQSGYALAATSLLAGTGALTATSRQWAAAAGECDAVTNLLATAALRLPIAGRLDSATNIAIAATQRFAAAALLSIDTTCSPAFGLVGGAILVSTTTLTASTIQQFAGFAQPTIATSLGITPIQLMAAQARADAAVVLQASAALALPTGSALGISTTLSTTTVLLGSLSASMAIATSAVVAAQARLAAALALAGSGSLTVSTSATIAGSAQLSAQTALLADAVGRSVWQGSGSLAGAGALASLASLLVQAQGSFAGTGGLASTARQWAAASAQLASDTSLRVRLTTSFGQRLDVITSLNAATALRLRGAALADTSTTLTASAVQWLAARSALAISAGLIASAAWTAQTSARLAVTSALAANVTIKQAWQGAANLSITTGLLVDATIPTRWSGGAFLSSLTTLRADAFIPHVGMEGAKLDIVSALLARPSVLVAGFATQDVASAISARGLLVAAARAQIASTTAVLANANPLKPSSGLLAVDSAILARAALVLRSGAQTPIGSALQADLLVLRTARALAAIDTGLLAQAGIQRTLAAWLGINTSLAADALVTRWGAFFVQAQTSLYVTITQRFAGAAKLAGAGDLTAWATLSHQFTAATTLAVNANLYAQASVSHPFAAAAALAIDTNVYARAGLRLAGNTLAAIGVNTWAAAQLRLAVSARIDVHTSAQSDAIVQIPLPTSPIQIVSGISASAALQATARLRAAIDTALLVAPAVYACVRVRTGSTTSLTASALGLYQGRAALNVVSGVRARAAVNDNQTAAELDAVCKLYVNARVVHRVGAIFVGRVPDAPPLAPVLDREIEDDIFTGRISDFSNIEEII